MRISEDQDARVGHKNADSSFFGYKTHLAMTEEKIITAAVVTSDNKNDGKQLQTLIKKSKEAGVDVQTVIGDTPYLEKENNAYSREQGIRLISNYIRRLRKAHARKRTNSSLTKTRACTYAKPVT